MKWWPAKEKLYVGTNRSWLCWSYASLINTFAILAVFYPPNDPDVVCTPDSRDLPLQAEIWAWHGPTDTWEMVFRSPADVPIPNDPQGRFVARDIGFRTMNLFIEPDGTEALYVGATNAKPMYEDRDTPNLELPPPRIYRSTEGTAGSFEPIPQDPGTVMGDLPKSSFRSLVTYNDKLYVIHSTAQGNGKIYESANPKEGNDAWRQVSPDNPELRSFELQPFNDYLYVGALGLELGYAVLKTDATGEPPYEFIPVVEKAGYLRPRPSKAVVSMHVFNDKLSPTNDPAFLVTSPTLGNITTLSVRASTYEQEQEFGGLQVISDVFSVKNSGLSDARDQDIQAFYDLFRFSDVASFFSSIEGPLVLRGGLDNPMSRPSIVFQVRDNFTLAPLSVRFSSQFTAGGITFNAGGFKFVVKEGSPGVPGLPTGLIQVNNVQVDNRLNPAIGVIISYTLDGTVFSETIAAPPPIAEGSALRIAWIDLLDQIELDARFDVVNRSTEPDRLQLRAQIIATSPNTPFEFFIDAGVGLRIEFRDIST